MTCFFAWLDGMILKGAAILSHPENGGCIWVSTVCLADKPLHFAALTRSAHCCRNASECFILLLQKGFCSTAEAVCGRDKMVAAFRLLLCGLEKTALFCYFNKVDLSKAEKEAVCLLAAILACPPSTTWGPRASTGKCGAWWAFGKEAQMLHSGGERQGVLQ